MTGKEFRNLRIGDIICRDFGDFSCKWKITEIGAYGHVNMYLLKSLHDNEISAWHGDSIAHMQLISKKSCSIVPLRVRKELQKALGRYPNW